MFDEIRSKINKIKRMISYDDESQNNWRIINDPIHKTMIFTEKEKNLIKPFLDHRLFQRLRGIKQMGLADMVFPGAVHNRFSHSLGACHIATYISKTTEKGDEDSIASKAFILSALLHDIGHGPYSHAFEQLYIKDRKKILTHEDWSMAIIKTLFTNDNILKESYAKQNGLTIKQATSELNKIYIKIYNIFNSKGTDLDFYSSLISSQLDVDRMDYLLRDSYYCGVEYGNYDLDWLLHTIRKCKDAKGVDKLTITPKGIGVVESFLLSRYLMRKHICLNKKVQSAEYLIIAFISEICNNKSARAFLLKKLADNTFLNFIQTLTQQKSRNIKHDKIKENIINSCFNTYQLIVDADVYMLLRQINELKFPNEITTSLKDIADRLLNRQLPSAVILRSEKKFIFSKTIAEFQQKNIDIKKWQISLRKPSVPECHESKEYPILVSAEDCSSDDTKEHFELEDNDFIASDLEMSSKIISRISNLEEEIHFLFIDAKIIKDPRIKKLIDKLKYQGCATYFR